MTTAAAAPSEVWTELPAVTVPLAWKTGFSLARASSEVSARGPSSCLKVASTGLALPFPLGGRTCNCDGHDFVFEFSGGDCGERLLVALVGELVHLLAGDAVVGRDALGGEAHGHVGAGVVVDEPGVDGDFVAAEGHVRHALGAAGDDDVRSAATDALCGERDGLQAGGAVAVDGHAGDGNRQTGAEAGDAGDVHSLLGFGHGAAEDDVFDLGAVELRDALKGAVDGEGGEIVRARGAKRAARGLAYGGADGGCDDDFFHLATSARCLVKRTSGAKAPSLL